MQALSKLCYQAKKCPDYGKSGANNLTVCGRYGKNNHIRLFNIGAGLIAMTPQKASITAKQCIGT